MSKYDPQNIESKWQKKWQKDNIYKTGEDKTKPKYYVLDMFPYPSGDGLHVGHPKGYIATDIFSRQKRMQGYNVLHPMGWDAFGLPAENYALKNRKHPREATEQNISTFKSQLEKLGFSYDWEREIDTTDPKFYKWTQWIFLQLFKKGLAYESHEPINWCPSCKTGLANEDLEDGKCERCGSEIEQKPMRQWVLAIRKYADRMLEDLDKLPDWEDSIKEMQKNWIGRSEGARVKFKVKSESQNSLSSPASDSEGRGSREEEIEVFTTRPDTLFGATYFVVSPEHPLIKNYELQISNYDEVVEYVEQAKKKTELERTDLAKEKTGVELKGIKAVNPVNGEEIPVWVADYVLMGYGTGAIMAVPAHDERDFEFAQKYKLPIKQVVAPLYEGKNENEFVDGKEEKTRRAVDVILKHWDKDEYYCLDWSKSGNNTWRSIVIGGIKDGETLEEAALREAKEETGYQNMKVIKRVGGEVHSKFYAAHKDLNRYSIRNCVYIELIDGEQIGPDEEHIKNHYGKWVAKNELMDYLTIVEQKEYLQELFGEHKVFSDNGVAINSEILDGLNTLEAKDKIITWLEEKSLGHKDVNYKIQDWVFSRQRYWGEPFPLVYCEHCREKVLELWREQGQDFEKMGQAEIFNFQFSIFKQDIFSIGELMNPGWVEVSDLPVELPQVESYEPSGTGESPLATMSEWLNVDCPKCGGRAKRETNTMPQWAGSSWYYLRYIDPDNDKALVDKDKDKYWSPVDFYVGGAEHATRHLIYARFWHKFLYDIGVVNYDEPFKRLQHVGLIQAEDGRKMSKRWGNVINPDSVVESHGADAMRVYEMFMGPFSQACAWSTSGLTGTRKFLDKVWNLQDKIGEGESSKEIRSLVHKTIKKVGEDIEDFKLNTAVSAMMILVNAMEKDPEKVSRDDYKLFIKTLSPFAPHMCEEIWQKYFDEKSSIVIESWPEYNEDLIKDETIKIAIQVNGKVRDTLEVDAEIDEAEIKKLAQESAKVKKWIEGKEIKKVIYVKGKLVSIVV